MKISYAAAADLPARNFVSTAYDFEMPLSNREFRIPELRTLPVPIPRFVADRVIPFDHELARKNMSAAGSTAEKIVALFLTEGIFAGDRAVAEAARHELVGQLEKATSENKRIIFTLLQFPFKIPNPLKTERTLPDLGELAYLKQMHEIATLIAAVYEPGALFVVLGESLAFRSEIDLSFGEVIAYREASRAWIRKLGYSETVELVELRELEPRVSGFADALGDTVRRFTDGYAAGDPEIRELVDGTVPTLFTSMNLRGIDRDTLLEVYGDGPTSPAVEEIRSELDRIVVPVTISYLAYHATVKDTGMRSKLWPGSIGVSPIAKPGRFGMFPMNSDNKLYPIHGVAVFRPDGRVVTRYKADVLRDPDIRFAYTGTGSVADESSQQDPLFYTSREIA